MGRETGKRVAGREPKERKGKKSGRLNRQQRILLVVAICLAVILLLVVACQSLFHRPEVHVQEEDDQRPPQTQVDYGESTPPKTGGERKSEDFYTVLVLGRDTGGGGNTDTMLLASYDVTNQRAAVMSIPRDTMVNVPWDVKKINSVYNMNNGGEEGIHAVYKEIAQLVGFEPDFRVVVEWEAVGKLVEAIGGVQFDVPYEMDYFDPVQDLVIKQAKGYRLLNGDDAMQVIRWRQNSDGFNVGDEGRMKIQQDFLKAIIKQMMTPANVLNISKIAKVFEENVETDMSFQNILWFGQQAFSGGLSMEDVSFFTMPFKLTSAFSRLYSKELGRPHYLSYVVPDADALLEIVNGQLSPFKEASVLSDLDVMYVNRDGSVGSTSGFVEDSPAAKPPDLTPYASEEEDDPDDSDSGMGDIEAEPDTGVSPDVVAPDPGDGDSGSGTTNPPEVIAPEPDSGAADPGVTAPEVDPEVIAPDIAAPEPDGGSTSEPQEPISPDFSIIEPPPAA